MSKSQSFFLPDFFRDFSSISGPKWIPESEVPLRSEEKSLENFTNFLLNLAILIKKLKVLDFEIILQNF